MQRQLLNLGFNVSLSGIEAMRGLADGLSQTLRLARALVGGGRSVDIAGLDRQVGLLCAKTLDLCPEDGRTLRPVLVGLLADLDALSAALAEQTRNAPAGGLAFR